MNFLKIKIRCEKCRKLMESNGWSHEIEIGENDLTGILMKCKLCGTTIKVGVTDW